MKPPQVGNRAVIAIVKGGLGNQLFIYAAARALALRTGRDLYLDTQRGYTHDSYGRSYRLDCFAHMAKPMPEAWRLAPTLKHPRHKLIRAWNKLLPRDHRSYLAERHQLDASQLTALCPRRQRVTLLGYWHDEKYFADQADVIRHELAAPQPSDSRNLELGRACAAENTVSLHVRRIRYRPLLSHDYYQKAIHAARATLERPRFVLFGDDLDWLRANLDFGDAPVEEVGHNTTDELADLWLMGCCRHSIIANSSFSWWGAWLAGTPRAERYVWAPAESGLQLVPAMGWRVLPGGLHEP